ncbi:MAG: hypothetical protein L0H94_06150 [Nitrospira sp.]|nr:hypothetical protein [Nitrospira sp.]
MGAYRLEIGPLKKSRSHVPYRDLWERGAYGLACPFSQTEGFMQVRQFKLSRRGRNPCSHPFTDIVVQSVEGDITGMHAAKDRL